MYRIDDHIACAVAGITADANILLNFSRLAAQRYSFLFRCCAVHGACHCACDNTTRPKLTAAPGVRQQRYLFAYQEPVPVEQLVQQVCDTKQGYTQYGGMYAASAVSWWMSGGLAPDLLP